MLSFIRSLARSPIFGGFIIALLVAAFALFGVNDIFTGTGNAAVTVGNQQVLFQDLQRAYQRQIFAIQQENQRFTQEQAEQFGLGEQTVQLLTSQAAIEAKATELGLAVSRDQVADQLTQIQAFQNPFTGDFDRDTYIQILQQNGYPAFRTGEVFEAELRDDLLRAQVITAILGGVQAPEIMATSRRAFEQERRTINALLLPPTLAEEAATPDDETLTAFINDNVDVFQQPEQRRFTLVRFSPSDFTRDVEVSEDELRELYEFQVTNGDLAAPATRSITQWIALDEASANASVSALQAGQTPAEAGLADGVELENVQAFEIPDATIAEAAFEQEAGAVFAVEGRLGWRVVRVDAAEDPEVPSFESQRAALVEQLSGNEAAQLMADALSRFETARSEGLTFEEAGLQANVPVERFDFLTARGATVEGVPASTLRTSPEIVQAAFETPPGFETDAEYYGQDSYFMLRVDEITPQRVPELDEIRSFVEAVWRARNVDDQLQAIVEDAMARVEAGESLNDVAASIEGSVVETAMLSRTESTGPFSPALVRSAFAQDQGIAFEARASDPSTRVVAVVADVTPPGSRAMDPTRQAALSEELGNDITAALESALFASYEIRQNQELIDLALGRIDPEDIQ